MFEAGIDTCRFLWRIDSDHDRRVLGSLPALAPLEGTPLRLDFDAGHGILAVEGRAITALDYEAHRLLPPVALGDAHDAIVKRLRSMGVHYLPDEGISRLDATATMRLETAAQGFAVLHGMAAIDTPRLKPNMIGRPLETVKWVTQKRAATRATAYDKGHQLGTAARGTEIRLEARSRYGPMRRRRLAEWRPDTVKDTFDSRFKPMRASADGLHVMTEAGVRDRVRELVESERISARQAELLLGHLACEAAAIPRARSTVYRRRSELRRLGLALALDGADDQEVDVPLHELLDELLNADAWHA